MMNDDHLSRMLLDQSSKVPKHKLKKTVNQIAQQALERDCMREFGQSYAVVMRRANRALRVAEGGTMPDETDAKMLAFIGERAKFFEVIGERMGIEIEVK